MEFYQLCVRYQTRGISHIGVRCDLCNTSDLFSCSCHQNPWPFTCLWSLQNKVNLGTSGGHLFCHCALGPLSVTPSLPLSRWGRRPGGLPSRINLLQSKLLTNEIKNPADMFCFPLPDVLPWQAGTHVTSLKIVLWGQAVSQLCLVLSDGQRPKALPLSVLPTSSSHVACPQLLFPGTVLNNKASVHRPLTHVMPSREFGLR